MTRVLFFLLIGVGIIGFLVLLRVDRNLNRITISTEIMSPTFRPGTELVIATPSESGLRDMLVRGGVVVYRLQTPEGVDSQQMQDLYEETQLIGRVIAIGSDTVFIDSGDIFVNGVLVKENYINSSQEWDDFSMDEVVVPEDSYLILADNRDRIIGFTRENVLHGIVPLANIDGVVVRCARNCQ